MIQNFKNELNNKENIEQEGQNYEQNYQHKQFDNFTMNEQSLEKQSSNIVNTIKINQFLTDVSADKNQQTPSIEIEEDLNSLQTKEDFKSQDMQYFRFPEGIEYQENPGKTFQNNREYFEDINSYDSTHPFEEGTIVNKQNEKKKKILQLKYDFMLKSQIERQLSTPRKFYLFLDQMIDLDYFQNIKQLDQFVENNQSVQLQKGFRATNSVIHRMDNTFIEIDSELIDSSPQSIDYIIQIMKSIGNKDLLQYINCLIEFSKNIKTCKTLILEQSLHQQFLSHRLERQVAAENKFKEITSKFDPTKLIFYQRYTINYDKCLYQTTKAGYSPALYEVLDNGSYCFMDKLLKEGFYDPMSQIFRLGDCFYRTCYFMSQLPKEFDSVLENNAELDLVTCDNFRFPVTMKLEHQYLEQEYDQQNGLDLKFCELLAIYEFQFQDPNAYKNLQQIRKESINQQSKLETIEGEGIDWNKFDYVQTQFFNKYYSDQVENLVRKGNKWFKKCGFVDIPTKKIKQ